MNIEDVFEKLKSIELPGSPNTLHMKLKTCEVGMFKLPGIIVEKPEDCTDEHWQEIQTEMDLWANSEQGTGTRMTDSLWSFRKQSQRDWFILKWSGNESL